jgi:hypothetical protein
MTEPHTLADAAHDDPLVAEVRATRAALSAAAGHDLARLVATIRIIEAAERAAGRTIIEPPTRPSAAA